MYLRTFCKHVACDALSSSYSKHLNFWYSFVIVLCISAGEILKTINTQIRLVLTIVLHLSPTVLAIVYVSWEMVYSCIQNEGFQTFYHFNFGRFTYAPVPRCRPGLLKVELPLAWDRLFLNHNGKPKRLMVNN